MRRRPGGYAGWSGHGQDTVDNSECRGHARCNASSPQVYPIDEDGYVVLHGETEVDDALPAQAELALTPDETARQQRLAQLETIVPSGRIGDPDELASAVAFLASDAASYVNGADPQVDGGVGQI